MYANMNVLMNITYEFSTWEKRSAVPYDFFHVPLQMYIVQYILEDGFVLTVEWCSSMSHLHRRMDVCQQYIDERSVYAFPKLIPSFFDNKGLFSTFECNFLLVASQNGIQNV